MGRFVTQKWPGDPGGATRAARSGCRFNAYVPDLLIGSTLSLPASVAADISDVEQQVRQLNVEHPGLANLEPLSRFLLRAEAVGSSHIEGLVLNVRRLARTEAQERDGLPVSDDTARAVLGNINALDAALNLAADSSHSITTQDILNLHQALLGRTRDHALAGVVRDEQNWVGGASPCSAAFVPPPAEEVPQLLDDLAAYLSTDEHPALMQAAVAHAQFETIHPFADGNGRTGRALIQLVLRRRGVATRVFPPISLVLATRAREYVAALDATRSEGDTLVGVLEWLELFLSETGRACAEAERFAADLTALERAWREKLGRVRSDAAVLRLLNALPALPVFTVTTAAAYIERSYPQTRDAVTKLVDAGVVRQVSLARRNRAFEVVGLFEAFTGYERALASPAGDTAVSPPVRQVPARPRRR